MLQGPQLRRQSASQAVVVQEEQRKITPEDRDRFIGERTCRKGSQYLKKKEGFAIFKKNVSKQGAKIKNNSQLDKLKL